MSDAAIRRALISVFDKTGVEAFARALSERGVTILSTGGTARRLRESGLEITLVETVAGAAEMLDGRVKTLHPAIHGGILADRANADHMRQLGERGIEPIDMVVVDLYPFEDVVARPDCTLAEAIEMIDIGGPCMLRAAAKNHAHVVVVPGPRFFSCVLDELNETGQVSPALRARLAAQTFAITSAYDATVDRHLRRLTDTGTGDALPATLNLRAEDAVPLRSGENPHQSAALYQRVNGEDARARWSVVVNEDRMSLNNHVDAAAAYELVRDLSRAGTGPSAGLPRYAAGVIKHTNPCGAAVADDPIEAYRKAYLGDPMAAMGGVLAVNFPVTVEVADAVLASLQRWGKSAGAGAFFVEVWVAPAFDADAIKRIATGKAWGARVRLIMAPGLSDPSGESPLEIRRFAGGLLAQSADTRGLDEAQWTVATERGPSEAERNDLRLAWLVCKHTKSNAITLARDGMLLGVGAGQMSRVTSCRVAVELAGRHVSADTASDRGRGGMVAASDAFFPFADGPARLADAGVTGIIQPGGSKRDDESIALCNERDLAMVLTGTRHFRH